MTNDMIEKLLTSYEKGGISRRKFLQSVNVLAATPSVLAQSNKSIFQGKSLNHVTLAVKDVKRSSDFYQKLLGLHVRYQDSEYCSFDLDSGFFALYKDGRSGRNDHFCIGIESFNPDVVFEKLKREYPSSSPTIENDKEVYLRDPDNIRFQLSSVDYRN